MIHKCPKCKYEWKARVKTPKQCPYCKRYLPLLLYDLEIKKRKKEVEDEKEKGNSF